ncbi:Pentapeptide_repeats-containing protein [Hexamita inflata]|uniref:Pentapeptide_repeats-containing protein n=1 Tax=Hexamita inflata TaxID=28002 RepID=A0ABP1JHK9_9EUKA
MNLPEINLSQILSEFMKQFVLTHDDVCQFIQSREQFLLILDSYDQINCKSKEINIYKENNLELKNCKVIFISQTESNMNTQTQNKFCNDINFFEHIILKPFNQHQIQNYFQFIKSQNVNNNQLYYSISYLDNLENKKHLIIMFLIRQYCIQLHRVKMMLPKIVKYRNLFQHISHKINICLYSFNASILKSLNLTYVIKIICDYKFQTHLLEELQNQIISQNINADIFIKFQNYNFKFNTKLIFETQHLKYIIKKCQENKNLQTTLLNILYQSKTQSEIKIAAANALTILNISGYKFIGRDLSNIQVPGATLSKGIFNNCIFKNANFQTCNFQQHSFSNTVKLWDIHKAECLKTIKIKHIGLNQIIFSNDCLLFCTSSMNGTIKIWDTLTGTCQSSIIQAHNQPITAICFSHDNQCICSAAEDKLIKIWDITTRTCTDTFTGHLQSVTALYFSKDNILYSGSHDQTIKQWGKNSKSCIQTYYGHHDCISSIFECNNYIYSASWDKTIKIWRKDQDKSLQTLYGHSDIIQTLCISQDGKYICSGSQDKTVKLWQINKYNNCWECQNTYMGHLSRITCVQIFTQHNTQHNIHVPKIISGSRDNNIKIWEIYQGKIQLNQFYNNDYDPITLIKFSDDGQYVCSASINGILKLWNVQSGQSQIIINTHTNCITALCFSFDCQYICSGTDKSINVWETKTGKCKYVFQEISRGINSICFSQDGQFVCAGFNNIIKLWLIENGQCSHKFIQNNYIQIKQVCISQQNILYAVINNLKLDCYQVYQWNLSQQDNNKEEIFEFTENMKTIQQIFLATNGNYLCYIQNQSLIVKQLSCLEFICGIIDQKDVINADIIVSQNIFYVQIIYRDQQACLVVLERTYQQQEQQQINTLLSKITIQKNTFIEIRSLKYSHLRVNHIIWLKQQYAIYIMF